MSEVQEVPDVGEIAAGFPFESRFVEVAGSKIHYVEEGSGGPVLFLHGNPTSSYLWRNVIPHVSPTRRAIAMDLIGMGKSAKPDIEYRFFDHYRYVEGFIRELGLQNLVLVVHDWGAPLGLHYARQHRDNVRAVAMMEPILAPVPSWDEFPPDFVETIRAFRTPELGWELVVNQNMFVERILPGAIVRDLSEAEMERYREPYVDITSRKPVWRWPNELPIAGEPGDVVDAIVALNGWLRETEVPKLLLHATPGAIMPPAMVQWCIANLKNLETVHLGQGVHYLQEDHPHDIGRALADWLTRT